MKPYDFNKVPCSSQVLEKLSKYESRNVTFQSPDQGWPIVWDRARGVHVWDPEGRRFLDLTAAFGVAAAGHSHPRVVLAGQRQLARMPHAMGDVHPHALKADLCERLSELTFQRWMGGGKKRRSETAKTILGSSGSDAVEAALKTAFLATGERGLIAFEGGYHGLGYGALNATHRDHFRKRFEEQLGGFAQFFPFPESGSMTRGKRAAVILEGVEKRLRSGGIGAVLIEPVQARGGIRVPPRGFLKELAAVCRRKGVMLILDEIYTGFGRTGKWFACEHEGVVPDLICLGKAMTGGFPLSACVGRSDLMDAAWPPSNGEAIHTSTFLGNPVGCAMALANLDVIHSAALVEKSRQNGEFLRSRLSRWPGRWKGIEIEIRGSGLMVGAAFKTPDGEPVSELILRVVQGLLKQGVLALPEGEHGEVLSWTPPLCISRPELALSVRLAEAVIDSQIGSVIPTAKRGRSTGKGRGR